MNGASLWSVLDGVGFEVIRTLLSVLWQSSILLVAVGILAYALRRRRAAVRQVLSSGELSGGQKREIETAAEYRETKTLRVKPAAGGEDVEETEE